MRDDQTFDPQDDAATRTTRSGDTHSYDRLSASRRQSLTGWIAELRDGAGLGRSTARAGVGEDVPSRPRLRRVLAQSSPAQVATAAAVLCCFGLGLGLSARGVDDAPGRTAVEASRAAEDRAASRATDRASGPGVAAEAGAAALAEAQPAATDGPDAPPPPDGKAKGKEGKKLPPGHRESGPVAGLSDVQMNNAKAIVWTGVDIKMPRRALEIAVATALQESDLLNRASEVVPESKNHPHQGTGWDHDSVGLFQQRTSSGWGPVDKLMDPAYASQQFYYALLRVPGWQGMQLTYAAQAVQVSAFPDAYAKHEGRAKEIVNALTDVS